MKLFMGYSKAPEQPQSSARPMCHSHTMTNTGREPATIRMLHIGARRATHYAMGDDSIQNRSTFNKPKFLFIYLFIYF